jgi:hypothetical protein
MHMHAMMNTIFIKIAKRGAAGLFRAAFVHWLRITADQQESQWNRQGASLYDQYQAY